VKTQQIIKSALNGKARSSCKCFLWIYIHFSSSNYSCST